MNSLSDTHEQHIVRSWHANAAPWVLAIDTGSIVSRRLVTDQAITDAVTRVARSRVLDVGCGEGWLSRALNRLGFEVVGVDVVPELIAQASRRRDAASRAPCAFEVLDYADFVKRGRSRVPLGGSAPAPFDAAVCNFSLLGCESVESMIAALPLHLRSGGHLIVQTLHPLAACGSQPYTDGWRGGNWSGCPGDFSDPPPWYFRTLESWFSMLRRNGFNIVDYREPTATGAVLPSSVVFTCKADGHHEGL